MRIYQIITLVILKCKQQQKFHWSEWNGKKSENKKDQSDEGNENRNENRNKTGTIVGIEESVIIIIEIIIIPTIFIIRRKKYKIMWYSMVILNIFRIK